MLIVEADLGWKRLRRHMNLRHLPLQVSSNTGGKVEWAELPPTRSTCRKDHSVMQAFHKALHEMGSFDHVHE